MKRRWLASSSQDVSGRGRYYWGLHDVERGAGGSFGPPSSPSPDSIPPPAVFPLDMASILIPLLLLLLLLLVAGVVFWYKRRVRG